MLIVNRLFELHYYDASPHVTCIFFIISVYNPDINPIKDHQIVKLY